MSSIAEFDVVEFSYAYKTNLRTYYRYDDDKSIRESCFREDYGWFVRGNGVVTRDAKTNSPIAATCWLDDNGKEEVVSPFAPFCIEPC
jgi:hypothetical protein